MSMPKHNHIDRINAALRSLLHSDETRRLSLLFPVRLVLASRGLPLLLLLALLVHTTAYAASPLDATSAKKMIIARGVGHSVKVHEGKKIVLRGKIVSLGEDDFLLRTGSKSAVNVPYNEVTQVQTPGLPTAAKIGIAIGAGIVIGVTAVILHATSGPLFPNGLFLPLAQ